MSKLPLSQEARVITLLQTAAFRSSIIWSLLLCGSVANILYAIAEQVRCSLWLVESLFWALTFGEICRSQDTELPGQDVLWATLFAYGEYTRNPPVNFVQESF